MAVIKRRPDIRLLTAPELTPGQRYPARIILDATAAVDVDWVDLIIEGVEKRSVGSGKSRRTARMTLCALRARVSGPFQVQIGRAELPCAIQIPPGSPPSYRGADVRVSYRATARASIPWWPDAKARFELAVGYPDGIELSGEPVVFSSAPEDPAAGEAYMEGSLASDVLAAGGSVAGAIALSNVDHVRYAGVRLSLIALEYSTVGIKAQTEEVLRYDMVVSTEGVGEGEPIPFVMRLPQALPPSFSAPMQRWALSWYVEVRAEIRWARDLRARVPVSLLPPRYAAELERPRHAPPLVGSERVQRLWREVAERHELAFDGRAMRGERRGVTVAVEREHRGRGGVHLVGQLAYPSLDLDLNIEPAKRWRSGRRGVQIGADAWDRAHRVTCRDDSQIHAVLPALRPALLPLSALHLDDTGARAERRDAGTSKQRLWDFANKMVVLANAVAAARERVPPPTSMRDHADAWRELAATLDGALSVARMQIAGTAGGMPAFVRTEWSADGEPLRTVLGVRTPHIIDQRHRGVWSADSDGERDDEAERSDGEPASPTRARALSAATAWEIAADSIAITREAPIADPRPLAAQLRAIAAWSRELSSVGVYR